MYDKRNIDMRQVFGVGSICRRRDTSDAEKVLSTLKNAGLKLHAFGLKVTALQVIHPYLYSADSFAWSFVGRNKYNPHHMHRAQFCSNCIKFALEWREETLQGVVFEPLTGTET
jgi:hypothetical protein